MKHIFGALAALFLCAAPAAALDRLGPNGAAIHLAPGVGANGNIQFTALWASQGSGLTHYQHPYEVFTN